MKNKNFSIFFLLKKVVFTFLFFSLLGFSFFGYGQEVIYRVQIEGNDLISDARVISEVRAKAGQPYSEDIINEDIKNLYATGFFEEISTEVERTSEGVDLTFVVSEKPVVNQIKIIGQRHIRQRQIVDEINLEEGSFIDEYRIAQAVRKIEDLYNQRGFSRAEIRSQLIPVEEGRVDVEFTIAEEGIVKVRAVKVEGNDNFSDNQIRRLMKTRKAWLFNRGIFREREFADDLRRIEAFYQEAGFTDVSVDSKKEYKEKGVYITLKIDEGKRYYVGEVVIRGDQELSRAEIEAELLLEQGNIFSERAVYEASAQIRQLYVDRGYIFAQVEPVSVLDLETEKVNVTFDITENHVAYIENIRIKGNTKTKDRVIRRELKVYPAERFDGEKLRQSRQDLENLGFFEDIRIRTEPGSDIDKVDLIIDVQEAKTGYFSFGGGYSSIDEFIGFVELRQRNFDYRNLRTFTGAGQDLSLKASIGTITSQYQLSFTNPWIFDRPVSFGFDAYRKGHDKDSSAGYAYSEEVTGGALRLGRKITDKVRGSIAYRFDNIEISDTEEASQSIQDEEGTTNLSSLELGLTYDSRDNVFSPSSGIYFSNSFQLTGSFLGGDKDFNKVFSRLSFYFPSFGGSVLETRLRAGLADPFSGTESVPIYERFFSGGAGSIRGYRERKVGPVDEENNNDPLGGEALFVANIEYTYPLADFLKVATFYDVGNVWEKKSDFFKREGERKALYSSIGLGLRVKTPIGPVSVDYGWPLDLEPGETSKSGRFHFNVSRDF